MPCHPSEVQRAEITWLAGLGILLLECYSAVLEMDPALHLARNGSIVGTCGVVHSVQVVYSLAVLEIADMMRLLHPHCLWRDETQRG
jgi:hypothetical protein